jgi:Meiotically up-regulated gene 113
VPVYVIRIGDDGPCKIGSATDPVRRLRHLQTGQPQRLRLLHVFRGGAEEEAALHRRFAAVRISGEWFQPLEEIVEGRFGLEPVPMAIPEPVARGKQVPRGRKPKPEKLETFHAQVIRSLGGPVAVSKHLGVVVPSAVVCWVRRGQIPVPHWQALLELAQERGASSVTLDALMGHMKPRKPREPSGSAAVAVA